MDINNLIQSEQNKLENSIIAYRKQGLTGRQIAEKLGMPASSLDYMLEKHTKFKSFSEMDDYLKSIDKDYKVSERQLNVRKQWENGYFPKVEMPQIKEEEKAKKRQELIDFRKQGFRHNNFEKYYKMTSNQFRLYMKELNINGIIHLDQLIRELYNPAWRASQHHNSRTNQKLAPKQVATQELEKKTERNVVSNETPLKSKFWTYAGGLLVLLLFLKLLKK